MKQSLLWTGIAVLCVAAVVISTLREIKVQQAWQDAADCAAASRD